MATKFLHIGVPTCREHPNEVFLDGLKVYITMPEDHPFAYEFLRFVDGSPMPDCIASQPHAAFQVDNMEESLVGMTELYRMTPDEKTTIVFAMKDNFILELTEIKE